MLDVWTEKYRPRTFDEIVSQKIAINNLSEFVKTISIPYLIFTGPVGTGKTSTALIIAKYFLKEEELFLKYLKGLKNKEKITPYHNQ